MSFQDVFDMPIRAFWLLSNKIEQVRSEEIVAWLPSQTIAMGGEHVSKVFEGYQQKVGQPSIVEKIKRSAEDEAKLKRIFG